VTDDKNGDDIIGEKRRRYYWRFAR